MNRGNWSRYTTDPNMQRKFLPNYISKSDIYLYRQPEVPLALFEAVGRQVDFNFY